MQATMKRFLPSGEKDGGEGGSSKKTHAADPLAQVMLEVVDKSNGVKKAVKTKYYCPALPGQKPIPDHLPMRVVPLFLKPEHTDALKAELAEEAKTMVSRPRRVGDRVVQPLRLTKVVHNEE